ncbi:hypothetical protein [Acinetobacter sp. CAAS 2-6]|uniref:hypothetical protein n=1 Tax=Acinetobacter sp. CAAS 2-6 TaxID=3016358 RepID=UPI002DD67488|nr:hypothetical protein [Acinetobacter sp. CAAS 2-6]
MTSCVALDCFDTWQSLVFAKRPAPYASPDFKKMIDELIEGHALTHEKIAFVLPVANASTVSDWTRGGKPNYESGETFVMFWKYMTGKTDAEIPRINRWAIEEQL